MPNAKFSDNDLLKSIQILTGFDMTNMMVVKKTINEYNGEVEVFYRPKKQGVE